MQGEVKKLPEGKGANKENVKVIKKKNLTAVESDRQFQAS